MFEWELSIYVFFSINYLPCVVHQLEPKKPGIWLGQVDKTLCRLLVTSGCVYFLEKYDELSKLVVFGQKLYFTD